MFTVAAAGPELDDLIISNWREQWLANERPASKISDDQHGLMMDYIRAARDALMHMSFVARSPAGEIVGSCACQLWQGPMPVATHEKVGTVWAVFVKPEWRRKGVATQLMQAVIERWRAIGCDRGLLLCASEEARRVYTRLGFGAGPMLQLDLAQPLPIKSAAGKTVTVAPHPHADADAHVIENLRSTWQGSGAPLLPDLEERTRAFISRAKERRLEYQTLLATDAAGSVCGAAACHVWEGPGSNNHTWQSLIKLGVCWGLNGTPEDEVKAALPERVANRWRATGCTRGLVLAATPSEAAFYRRHGFEAHNGMVLDLSARARSPQSPIDLSARSSEATGLLRFLPALPALPAKQLRETAALVTLTEDGTLTATEEEFVGVLRASGATLVPRLSSTELASLRLALPQMLEAALPATPAGHELGAAVMAAQRECGSFVSGQWYTSNIPKFGGGFDMAQLTAQPGKLAAKFDRMAEKYCDWTVGNHCSYYHWVARAAREVGVELQGADARILDVACGIGLPGHTLRLSGFAGHLSGTDLSAGMLARSSERRVYDHLFVANANEGLTSVPRASLDLVLCVGAMEILDHAAVLPEFARILKPGGRLWATFQWEGAVNETGAAIPSPTAHQNVSGVTIEQLTAELEAAGFDAEGASIEKTPCAFYTPSPRQDGSVLPVPYLYVQVGLP